MVENESHQAPPAPAPAVQNDGHSQEELSRDEQMIASIFRDIISSSRQQTGETPMETDQREAETGQLFLPSCSSIES